MSSRHFLNAFADYAEGAAVQVDKERVLRLIQAYVTGIVKHTWEDVGGKDALGDPSLYVGDAGIAYMFLRLHNCSALPPADAHKSLQHADNFIGRAIASLATAKPSRSDACAWLCGAAGVHAIDAAVAGRLGDVGRFERSVQQFSAGFAACDNAKWDEILVGRAGYLSGAYWLATESGKPLFSEQQLSRICEKIALEGAIYSRNTKSAVPLMFQYHGTEYLGAAHGLSGILHALLARPGWMADDQPRQADVWQSVDALVAMQGDDGNFPTATDSAQRGDRRLMHWCHGAAGIIYMLLQAHERCEPLRQPRYMEAARRAADACWQRGLLRKGPGICHGVAGSGMAQLAMYRATLDERYLYRAQKCAEFLEDEKFLRDARRPDRPYSLFEGTAGTVCFLCDLLEPGGAAFPFMAVRVD